MVQCVKYPNECEGQVIYDEKDEIWYCEKHFYTLEHLKNTGRK